VRFTLTKVTAGFLDAVVRAPGLLQSAIAMLGQPHFAHYTAKEEQNSRMVIALRKWLEEKVLIKRGENEYVPHDEDIRVGLKKPYINQVKAMLTHYKALGQLSVGSEPYWELMDILEGKKFVVDDPSDEDEEEDEGDGGDGGDGGGEGEAPPEETSSQEEQQKDEAA